MRNVLRWSATGLVSGLFPGSCACGRAAEGLCPRCRPTARPAPGRCPPPGVDEWWAPFSYEGAVRELVARSKYRNRRAALAWLADAMVGAPGLRGTDPPGQAAGGADPPVDLVTWPPTTSSHRRGRGFDHAELLARAVARRLDRPAAPVLARLDDTAQTGRSAAARRTGPRFVATRPLAGARVLVIDDVATTGSTLAAAGRALQAVGAGWVLAVTAARTPLGGSAAGRSAGHGRDAAYP